ncbi:PilN family type IVB pilus formation outer membrane protein [Pseudaquabacterium terrae]|nr:PilN family type IVB pilus formation outer membrane protein [Aquabacterium terrae]
MLVSGCAGLAERIERVIDDSVLRAGGLKAQAAAPVATLAAAPAAASASAAAATTPPVAREEGLWIARSAIRMEPVENLPPVFLQPATFDRTVSSLSEFAERITLRAGLAVRVTPDAQTASQRTLQGESAARPATPAGAAPSLSPTPAPARNGANGQNGTRLAYSGGPLKGLLDMAAARFGVSWRPMDGGVQFYYTDTRSFQIRAIPGDASLSAAVGNTSSAAGGGGTGNAPAAQRNSQQNIAVSSRLSVFESIEKSVLSMLSTEGKASASPATGTISVTDTPHVLERVAKFLEEENRSLSRQVMIDVTVLAVSKDDLDDYGIKWDIVYGDLSRRFGIQNTYSPQSGSGSFSAAVLNTATSKLAGSSLMLTALSSQGRVRRETSASVATLNNQPVPVQVATQTTYLRSTSTSQAVNAGTTTTLEPGTITSGFNMTILPHVLSNGTVLLQFGTDISSLRTIRTVTSNGTTIETPEVDTRNFLQRVAMKSGDTLVISGFEQTDDNVDRKGVGDPKMILFGGGVKAKANKEVIVILVTPIAVGGA